MIRRIAKSLSKSFAGLGLALALSAVLGSSAQASLITFAPQGTAVTYQTGGLGFGPGNALAVGASPLVVGSTFNLVYQTHLTSLTGVNNVVGLNTAFQVTEVGMLRETVTSLTTSGGVTTATFALVPASTNRILIYENNAVTFNDATGHGFTDGAVIATVTPTGFTASQFSTPGTTVQFNQPGLGGNDSGTGLAVSGSGSTSINNNVASTNAAFFVSQPLVTSIFAANLQSFFDTAAPSLQFFNLSGATPVAFAPNIGAVNANNAPGVDIQFQVSGFTQSFTTVPEPASVAMTALGLIGVAAGSYGVRRRRALARA